MAAAPKIALWKFVKYWVPVIMYAGMIFYLSSLPAEALPSLFNYQDIVFHIVEYAFFALLINRSLRACYPGLAYAKRFILVFFIAFIYAVADEFHQSFVPARIASAGDLVLDSIGIFTANILYGAKYRA